MVRGAEIRFVSLFSGIEAASAAWGPLGWHCVASAEIEPFPCGVLAHHCPTVPNLGDVTKITEAQVAALGPVDVLVFGSPCQDLSIAGKREGLKGERSGLFHAGMRVCDWLRKHNGLRFALWENVPGAFSSNKGADFAVVVGRMAGLDVADLGPPPKGWGTEGCALGEKGLVEWAVLDAQWFGVAQRRKRVFALSDFGDWRRRPPILLEPEGLRGDSAPRRETGEGITPCLANGAHGSNGAGVGLPGDPSFTLDISTRAAVSFNWQASGKQTTLGFNDKGVTGSLHVGQLPAIAYGITRDALDRTGEGAAGNAAERAGLGILAEIAQTIKAKGPGAVAYAIQERAVSENPDAGPDGAGFRSDGAAYTLEARTVPQAIAFALRGREGGAMPEVGGDQVGALRAASGGSSRDYVAFDTTQVTSKANRSSPKAGDPCHPLAAGAHPPAIAGTVRSHTRPGSNEVGSIVTTTAVRRLTPRECERLQGFPDDYTLIPWRKGVAPDGPRYKSLGNSMAVPVMAWIGRQIEIAMLLS